MLLHFRKVTTFSGKNGSFSGLGQTKFQDMIVLYVLFRPQNHDYLSVTFKGRCLDYLKTNPLVQWSAVCSTVVAAAEWQLRL